MNRTGTLLAGGANRGLRRVVKVAPQASRQCSRCERSWPHSAVNVSPANMSLALLGTGTSWEIANTFNIDVDETFVVVRDIETEVVLAMQSGDIFLLNDSGESKVGNFAKNDNSERIAIIDKTTQRISLTTIGKLKHINVRVTTIEDNKVRSSKLNEKIQSQIDEVLRLHHHLRSEALQSEE